MRKARVLLALSIIAGLSLPAFAAGAAAGSRKHRTRSSHAKTVSSRFQPHQRAIDDARATEIQAALVKAGYLSGSPSGHWDAASIAAMTKMQSDNGWQTKLVPDSRALIKLGLGPSPSAPSPMPGTQATASLRTSHTLASAQ